jgi:hypothetical protein
VVGGPVMTMHIIVSALLVILVVVVGGLLHDLRS